jgi:hypothetical protein
MTEIMKKTLGYTNYISSSASSAPPRENFLLISVLLCVLRGKY